MRQHPPVRLRLRRRRRLSPAEASAAGLVYSLAGLITEVSDVVVRCNSWIFCAALSAFSWACSSSREVAAPAQEASSSEAPAASALQTDAGAPTAATSHGSAVLTTRAGHSLLAIDPRVSPYKVNLPRNYVGNGRELVSQISVCVSEKGEVTSVKILKYSDPALDNQFPIVIPRWRYKPYIIDGRATPFCYPMNYRVW